MRHRQQKPRLKKVQGLTQRELAFDAIRDAIFAGRFSPGDAITIRQLVEELGLGAMPVREGVQQLASLGALEFLPNRSVRVPFYTIEELEKIFQARILLESFATSLAAKFMTAKDFARMSDILPRIFDRTSSISDRLKANFQFHFTIYRASQSHYIEEMIERLWLRIGPLHFQAYRSAKEDLDEFLNVLPLHRKLISTLKARNGEGASKIMSELLTLSLQWYRRHTESFEDVRREELNRRKP